MQRAQTGALAWLAMLAVSASQVSCVDHTSCVPRESISCTDDVAYWKDSCGQLGEISERCECGCRADGSGCQACDCEPYAASACHLGDVWWFDSCGDLEELVASCPAGCTDGRCDNCVAQCAGRQCGPDGCGGSCGICETDLVCQTTTGTCVGECVADCAGRDCGSDGCGDVCGSCGQDFVCQTATGTCIAECSPDCTGRDCGADGCGGSCGGCEDGITCEQASGQCVVACDLPPIVTPTVLNYDLVRTTVSGEVTVNGQQMADDTDLDSYPRGYLVLVAVDTGERAHISMGETGAATFAQEIFAGSYDVYFQTGDYDQDVFTEQNFDILLSSGCP